jgi:hypothetical protein
MADLPELCPIGVRDDEPMVRLNGALGSMGIRQAVLRGVLPVEQAREIYADPDDYRFDERTMAWSAANQWKESA